MTVEQAIAEVRSKARGRTRYEGQVPFLDELLVGEIDRLREINAELLEALEDALYEHDEDTGYVLEGPHWSVAARAAIAKAKP